MNDPTIIITLGAVAALAAFALGAALSIKALFHSSRHGRRPLI
jgi:hypothetical protein